MALQKLWCDRCDAKVVDPSDPSTGKFHFRNCHIVNRRRTEPFIGDWVQVVWAICDSCEENTA